MSLTYSYLNRTVGSSSEMARCQVGEQLLEVSARLVRDTKLWKYKFAGEDRRSDKLKPLEFVAVADSCTLELVHLDVA